MQKMISGVDGQVPGVELHPLGPLRRAHPHWLRLHLFLRHWRVVVLLLRAHLVVVEVVRFKLRHLDLILVP